MPSRRLPNSMPAVIRTLKTARDAWKNTPNPADRAISAEHWAKLDDAAPASFLNTLLKEASDVDLALAAQAPLSTEFTRVAARLTLFVICHDAEHRAAMVPVLGKSPLADNPAYWRTWITFGKPGSLMPAFSKPLGGPLEREQIESLSGFLTSTNFPAAR